MKITRLVSLLLLLCVVCGGFLVSCKDGGEESKNNDLSGTVSTNPYYDDATQQYVASTTGNTYEGETVTFLTCGVNSVQESEIVFNTYEDGADAQLPTVVNEDLKRRAELVEEKLGITIEETYVFDLARKNAIMANTIRTGNMSGTDEYQVVVPCLYDGATLAVESQFHNLLAVEGLQIEAPWWNQTFNEGMTYADQLYYTIGDIGIVNKNSTACLFFNYDMWYDRGFNVEYEGDPYDLVRENRWTLDVVTEVSLTISKDLDRNGIINYDDEFGWAGQLDDMWSIFYASGERIAKSDSDGFPMISMYNERSATVMEKLQEFVQNDESYISANDYFNVVSWPTELTRAAFTENRCMFFNDAVGTVVSLGVMEKHFGIVPVPIQEGQDQYYSLVNPWTSTCFAIPISVVGDDLVMVADTLNVMGAISKNTVANSYYEIAIKNMKVRDDESVEMLDEYIIPNRGCDIGMVYAWGKLDLLLQDMAAKPVGTFYSEFDAKSQAAQTALDETIAFYKGE